jgi:hypothetical protein
MFLHEYNARVNVLNHFTKRGIIHQPTSARSIETPCRIIEVGIVMEIGSNFVSQVLQSSLFFQEIFALCLER